jgi:hypothetical protein
MRTIGGFLSILLIALAPRAEATTFTYTATAPSGADPTTQGWTYTVSGPGQSQGAVGGTLADPPLAWRLTDVGGGLQGAADEVRHLTATQVATALANGWSFDVLARIDGGVYSAANQLTSIGAMGMAFQPDPQQATIFALWFNTDASGNAIVVPAPWDSNPPILVGKGGYNDYKFTYVVASRTVSLAIDGATVLTGYTGEPPLAGQDGYFGWGSLSHPNSGQVDVRSATFTYNDVAPPPVPEPASLALVAAGALALGARRRRRLHLGA